MNNPNNYPQYPRKPENNVSGKELFVGLNILSKIGVIFLILGVIAFSIASKGYILEAARLCLVFAVGVIMIVVGELFYSKGSSKVFAYALIYGGAAELFVSSLIGYYGFRIFSEYAVPGTVLGAAAVSFVLSERHKSRFLADIAILGSFLPIFTFHVDHPAVYFFAGAAITAIHCANAVISRKNNYISCNIAGFIAMIIQIPMLRGSLMQNLPDGSENGPYIFAMIFAACGAFIYTAGPILNAIQENGKMRAMDVTITAIVQGVVLSVLWNYLGGVIGERGAGIVTLVMAVIYAITATGFILAFGGKTLSDALFINLALAAATEGLIMALGNGDVRYIVLHLFAAVVFTIGAFIERNLLRVWGIVLLSIAEIDFLTVFLRYEGIGKKLFITIVNIVLWLAILAPFIARKKHNTNLFRAYTTAAVLNAGFLGASVISSNIVPALEDFSIWGSKAGRAAFAALCAATLWMLIGFIFGKLKYMRTWGIVSSMIAYGIGLIYLTICSYVSAMDRSEGGSASVVMIIVTIVVNMVSVLAVLDITLQIKGRAPKFAKAIGLIVSAYTLITFTVVLGTNDLVKFTSFIISIVYIVTAAAWIVIGFLKRNAVLRRFGLALSLLASAKLFLFDFQGINPMGRTLLFIGFGLTLLTISFGYGIAEKSLKK